MQINMVKGRMHATDKILLVKAFRSKDTLSRDFSE